MNYNARPFPGRITLIRSSEFASSRDKDVHVDTWSELAGGGLEQHVVDSTHAGIFDPPEVRDLARVLSQCLERGGETT